MARTRSYRRSQRKDAADLPQRIGLQVASCIFLVTHAYLNARTKTGNAQLIRTHGT